MKIKRATDKVAPPTAEAKPKRKIRAKKAEGEGELKKALDVIANLPPPAPHVQRDEGVLMVRRCRYAEGVVLEESADEQRVPTPKFEGEIARTRVSLGITKSLGGFEFARIDVMVEMPCNPNPDDLRETNEFASQQATEFMNRELASIIPPATTTVRQRPDMSALQHG